MRGMYFNGVVPTQNNALLEKLIIRIPLGIKFWDHGGGEQIKSGLIVRAWLKDELTKETIAIQNPSGIYSFHNLPGLNKWEYPMNNKQPGLNSPSGKKFIIKVEDKQKRFLNAAAVIKIPHYADRIFNNSFGSPFEDYRGFRLFSAPTRPSKPHLAVVRAYLWDGKKGAAYALLKVGIEGNTWFGVADKRGMITVMFPYPMKMRNLDVSPPSNRIRLHEQSWNITIRAFYGGTDMNELPHAELPNFKDIIKQKQVIIFKNLSSPRDAIIETLTLGEEKTLKTSGTNEVNKSKLLIKSLDEI